MGLSLLISVALLGAPVPAKVLTLAQAIESARQHQPQIWQARATADGAYARADEMRAPLLPQLNLVAGYQRTTANYALRPGAVPASLMGSVAATLSADSFNYWNSSLTLSQYIWDFGQTTDRWRASKENAKSLSSTVQAMEQQVVSLVRTDYFTARAQQALIQVARENLANLDLHLKQIEGFVKAGTRPKIDLAQARTDRANGLVQLISAENNYAISKAQLIQAIGDPSLSDYDVQDETLPPIPGEEGDMNTLLNDALRNRPELQSLLHQIRTSQLNISSAKGEYGPALSAALNFTEAGVDLTNLAWNLNAGVNLTWPIFQGLLTRGHIKEQESNLHIAQAQHAGEVNQVRVELEQAQLQVRAAKATLDAVEEALVNAREQLRLAEGRYQSGVGSIIELGDARVAASTAAAQRIQTQYTLATARAALLKALGRAI